jgi:hypothetical protein
LHWLCWLLVCCVAVVRFARAPPFVRSTLYCSLLHCFALLVFLFCKDSPKKLSRISEGTLQVFCNCWLGADYVVEIKIRLRLEQLHCVCSTHTYVITYMLAYIHTYLLHAFSYIHIRSESHTCIHTFPIADVLRDRRTHCGSASEF